jgi:hypothetical protein
MTDPIAGQIRKVSPAAARVIQQAAKRRQNTPAPPRAARPQEPPESAFLRSLTPQQRTIRQWILRGDDPWDERFIPPDVYYHLLENDPLVEQAVRRWQGRLLLSRRGHQ